MFHLQKTATVSKYSLFACVCLWNQGLKNEYDRNVNNFRYLQLIVCGTCVVCVTRKRKLMCIHFFNISVA
jgi:hypothetical protein